MESVLAFQEKMRELYAEHSGIADIIGKGLLALFCLLWIRFRIPESPIFSNLFVIVVAALLCSVLPLWATALFSGAFIIGNAFGIGWDVGALAAVIFMIMYLLLLRFVEGESIVFILQPMAMFFGMPALLPICLGLRRRPTAILSLISGCVCYYLVENLKENARMIAVSGISDPLERLQLILGALVANREMVVHLLALVGVFLIVYAVRKLGFPHAPFAAAVIGAVIYLTFTVFGNIVAGTAFVIPAVIIGAVLSVLLAGLLVYLFFSVDYRRIERVEFEDDDFVYYVKAVPKVHGMPLRKEADDAGPGGPDTQVDFEEQLTDSLQRL